MSLDFQLRLVDGITPGARAAKRSLDQLDAQLRVVDRDLDQSARRRARAQAQQLRGDRQTAAQSRAAVRERERDLNQLVRLEERAARQRVRAAERAEREINRSLNREIANNERAERQRQRTQQRAAREGTRGALGQVGGALRGAGAGATAILTAVGSYGDDVRERNRANQQLDYRAMQLAAGDIGDARAAGDIRAAVARTATGTGLQAEDVLAGLAVAQNRFSALGDQASRTSYLTNVLPELARVALATSSPLEDVVATAGELQRQLGISNDALPNTLAQMVQMGRNGSVSFADMARHLGELGGMSARFLRTTGADAAHATALTGTLFQFAGRAGGSGDEAATRARGFLANFTSAQGQARLRGVLGTNVLDARGQLRTAAGQSQDDAFMRMVEQVYSRTRGNSGRFLTAIAGNDTESRALADQMFRDLAAHGGRLQDFRGLDTGARGATAANTQGASAAAILQSTAAQDAMRENRVRFQGTDFATAAEATRQQLAGLHESSPLVASVLDNVLSRGAMDTANSQLARLGTVGGTGLPAGGFGWAGAQRMRGTWMELAWNQSRQRASEEHDAGFGGVVRNLGETRAGRDLAINARAAEILTERITGERAAGRDVTRPVTLDSAALSGMQTAVTNGVVAGVQQATGVGGGTGTAGGFARGGE